MITVCATHGLALKGSHMMTSEFCVAVHALVYLNHKAATLSSEALAENICTHPARVRKVMARLKKAGLVQTKEGADGGYLFALAPSAVSLRQIGEAVGAQFVSSSWHSGSTDMECLVASGMAAVMDDLLNGLNETCKKQLEQITVLDIDQKIFAKR